LFSIAIDFFLEYISINRWTINNFEITNIEFRKKEIYADGIFSSFIFLVVLHPIIEEILQRSYLNNFIWNNVVAPINIGIVFIFILNVKGYYLAILCIIILIISNIVYANLSKRIKVNSNYLSFYIKNYKIYFYLSAISFGSVHIANYKVENFIPGLVIILVLPQIFGGLILGYIRLSMGLFWSICFHAFHNAFFLTFLLLCHRT